MPIVARIIGGIGNQMFQYAMARAMAERHDTDLYLDTRLFASYRLPRDFELTRVFGIEAPIVTDRQRLDWFGWRATSLAEKVLARPAFRSLRGRSIFIENGIPYDPAVRRLPATCYLAGNWQSEKYFVEIAGKIRYAFRFAAPLNTYSRKTADRICEVNAVSVHVRRGDYAQSATTKRIHGTLPIAYYQSAASRLAIANPNAVCFVFSDDIAWAADHLNLDLPCHYVKHNTGPDSWMDLNLMSLCRHHIIANSSFSWWGAWLGSHHSKTVIAPQRWFQASSHDDRDIIPTAWTAL